MTDIVERRARMRWPKSISGPIRVERHDCEGGLIAYEIWDHGPATCHRLCTVYEETGLNAKAEAEFVALAINNALGALMAIDRQEEKT